MFDKCVVEETTVSAIDKLQKLCLEECNEQDEIADYRPPNLSHALTYDNGVLCSIVTNTVPRYKLSKKGIIIVKCLNCMHFVYSKPIKEYLECWYCGIKMKKPLRPSKESEAIVACDVKKYWNMDVDYRDDPLAGKYTNDDERYLAEDAWRDLAWQKTNCFGDFANDDDDDDDDDDMIDYIDG